MAGHTILLNLFGGVALLLWGTHMVQSAILRVFATPISAALARASAGPIRAAATGAVAATGLQSATAVAMLLSSFVARGMIALAPALAVMLGADLGTTLAVQALSLNLSAVAPLLLIVGVLLNRLAHSSRVEQTGRVVIGLGLMLLALGLIVAASAPLRDSEVTTLVLGRLGHDPVLALLFAILFTWLIHSSVAFVLFVISLTTAGLVTLPLALILVLGANVGAGLVAVGLTFDASTAARRMILGNLAFRAIGALAVFAALGPITAAISGLGADPGRLAAHFHTLFNLGLAIVFLPLTGRAARLLGRLVPDPEPESEAVVGPRLDHLDPSLLDRPPLALNAATRAVLGLADKVELMLREAIRTFDDADRRRIKNLEGLEDEVDADQEAIKLYLAKLMQTQLSAEESARVLEVVQFTTNLEHIGDIIDKGLLRLAGKKQKQALRFSQDGWHDIEAFHALIAEQMRRALAVFVSRDAAMARELVAEKDRLRAEEAAASERHFRRLRDGLPETIETSALHLDVLRDLKRVNAHLTSVAYPILEATGELRGSRLRAPAAEREPVRRAAQPARASSAG
ncbi:MAG: Na/Pi cotransporter family protein [Amaricoccus sp.]